MFFIPVFGGVLTCSKWRRSVGGRTWSSPTFTSRKLVTRFSPQASAQRSEKPSLFTSKIPEFICKLHWPLLLYTPPLYYFLRQLFPGSRIGPSQRILYATLGIFLCELFRCMLQDLAALGLAIGRRLGWLRKYREWQTFGKEVNPLPDSVPLWNLHRHFLVLIGTAVLELVSFYEAVFWSERVGLVLLILSQFFFNTMTELEIGQDGSCKRVQLRTRLLMLFGDGVFLLISVLYYLGVFPLVTSSVSLVLLLMYLGLKYIGAGR